MNTPPSPAFINTTSYPIEFQQVILEKSQNFVGRGFVFTAISNFLQRHDRGYFTIIGAPGSGKSAILAKYVTENPHGFYYNAQLPGKNRAEEFIATICTQIAQTSQETSLPTLLQQVSDKLEPQQKFIIAIDALDAVNRTDQTPGSNLFYLPRYLPRGVYFLLTRRPYVRKQSGLLIEAPSQILDLAEYPQQNREDVGGYIRQYVNNSEELTAQLTAKSENNFMYLSQILPAISKEVDRLPPGLEAYYQQHLHKMISSNSPSFERKLKSFVLSVLVQVSSLLSAEVIASAIDADEYDVEEVLENWREFLTLQQIDGEIRYSLYHSSFRDFLSKQVNFA
ncbi:MAG: AAA family ATPase [Nostoc sp. NOS(2021)]|uniref:AAA family ATPase n=1 Tax=Nostoc sp. NOS(2021) TaxID=2815407 RepID=UPI0025F7B5AE|nr:AAA family ATPase [Nostoc sp. NOS(2021)]MBN3897327.1 AAA family ATPase [Nostoc sp. NOS(2021)]